MQNCLIATALAAFVTASPCLAQDADTPDARAQAAMALEQSMGGAAAMTREFTALRPVLIKMIAQAGQVQLGRAAELVDTVEIPDLQKHVPDLLAFRARIYAKYFTANDLQVMTAFYRSPTGQKLLANQAPIASEYMMSLQPLLRDIQAHAKALATKQAQGQTPATQPSH